ncbi:MAG TPA: dihydropteroate synthase [Verrucomicrobiae bacterium]
MLQLEYLAELLEKNRPAAAAKVKEFSLRGRSFAFNERSAIMGVINLSADSWYRESVCLNLEQAIQRAHVLQAQGADLIDVGAESSLSHAARVDDFAQKSKLLPLLAEMVAAKQLVSIETYSPAIARHTLEHGAAVINLTGDTENEDIYRAAADNDAAVIICFVAGKNVREVNELEITNDPAGAMRDYFSRRIELAERCGLQKIIIDPGLGFYYRNLQDSATRVRHQMLTFLNTFRLRTLGYPVCHALPHAFEYFGEEVRSAEPFFAMLAALGKTDLFRTHEVARTKAVLNTMAAFSPRIM